MYRPAGALYFRDPNAEEMLTMEISPEDARLAGQAITVLLTIEGAVRELFPEVAEIGRRENLESLAADLRGGSRYARAAEIWGDDPERWPPWNCNACGQTNSRWTLGCGRCAANRPVPDASLAIGSAT